LRYFLDNHDMDRFLFIAKGDKDALRRAAAVQMSWPGPVVIYYGTEVGLSQPVSTSGGMGLHVSRTPMLWGDEQDKDLLDYYKMLIRNRKKDA
jgi:glycosidase